VLTIGGIAGRTNRTGDGGYDDAMLERPVLLDGFTKEETEACDAVRARRPDWDERTAVMLAARWAARVGRPVWTDGERAEALAGRDQLAQALTELPDFLRGKLGRLVEQTDAQFRATHGLDSPQ
jgi:hypothetical protein